MPGNISLSSPTYGCAEAGCQKGVAMLENIYDIQCDPLSQKELNPVLSAHERAVAYQGGARAQLAGKRLDGLNLANRILTEIDLSAASLVGATLYGSNLQRASFYCADLRGCNLQAANLTRADMRGASFRGANLSYAVMDSGDLRAARMMIVGSKGASIMDRNHEANHGSRGSSHVPDGVDFSNCSMKNVSFGNAILDNADFSGAILEGVKFKGARLKNVKLEGAVLTGVDLKELAVPASALKGCVLDVSPEALARADQLKATLASHEQWILSNGSGGAPATVDSEDLRPLQGIVAGRRFVGLSARRAVAIGLDFSESQLQAAKFGEADLRGADFSNCDLRGVSFRGANLSHARFTKARLGSLKLAGGGAMAPDLFGATYSMQQFADAHLDTPLDDISLV